MGRWHVTHGPRVGAIVGILAIAVVLRWTGSVWWQSRLGDEQSFGFPDSHSYWELGSQLSTGGPYEYGGPDFRVFRAPGYPLLLAGLFRVVGADPPVIWARGVGVVLGTLTVAGLMWLGWVLFDASAGRWAGLLAAIYPGAVGMSIFVLAEGLFCLLMVLQLACWVSAWRAGAWRARWAWGASSGVLCAAAVLTRPSWLLFTPGIVGLLLLGPARRRHAEVGVVLLVAMMLAMVPWWVRNYRAVGHFVPTTLQVGASLYDGLNPAATGASNMPFSTPFYLAQKEEDARVGRSPTGFEVRLDRRLRDAAVEWAREHPREVAALMARKFARMWGPWPNAEEFRGAAVRWGIALTYLPVLLVGAIGVARWGRQGWPYLLCYMPAVYFTLLHVVFVSSLRYREPAMLMWLVLVGAVVSSWWLAGGARWRRGAAGAGVAPG